MCKTNSNYKVYAHIVSKQLSGYTHDKYYFGITRTSVQKRWENGSGYKGQYFYRAIQKYGWENIKHVVLYENLSKEDAIKKEIDLIAKYKSNTSKYGYNITAGGDGSNGIKISEETRAKISGENSSWFGRHHTNDELRKISESNIGKHSGSLHPASKPVYKYSMDGKFIEEYESVGLAGKYNDTDRDTIGRCCNGKYLTAGGFRWSYTKVDSLEPLESNRKRRPVFQLKDDVIIGSFTSVKEAEEKTGTSSRGIYQVLGGFQSTHKGFGWKYAQ